MIDWKLLFTAIGSALVGAVSTIVISKSMFRVDKTKINPTSHSQRKLDAIDQRRPPEQWNTVLFFPDSAQTAAIVQLVNFFENARVRIQLCLFRFSYDRLGEVIKKKFNNHRGLLIQIIIDFDVYKDKASGNNLLKELMNIGIDIRLKKSESHMHHKFAIIDEEAVLSGSLNWTQQGITQNYEDVIVTTNPRHVDKYMKRFNELWKDSKKPDQRR